MSRIWTNFFQKTRIFFSSAAYGDCSHFLRILSLPASIFPLFLIPPLSARTLPPVRRIGKPIYNMVYVPPYPRHGNENNCAHGRRARRTSDRKRFRTILSEIYGGAYALSAKPIKNPPRGVCRGAEIFRFFGVIICSCLPVRQPQPQPLRRPWGCCPCR